MPRSNFGFPSWYDVSDDVDDEGYDEEEDYTDDDDLNEKDDYPDFF